MDLKTELKGLPIAIPDLLPRGASIIIQKKTGKVRQSVTGMLRGEFGSDANILEMLKIVAEITRNEANKYQMLLDEVDRILKEANEHAANHNEAFISNF